MFPYDIQALRSEMGSEHPVCYNFLLRKQYTGTVQCTQLIRVNQLVKHPATSYTEDTGQKLDYVKLQCTRALMEIDDSLFKKKN